MLILLCLLAFRFFSPSLATPTTELDLLMQIKVSLDPRDRFLTSWSFDSDPCSGSFDGVACNEFGNVANISLQGKGLSGRLPAALGGLRNLTGLYLHFNTLNGEIPAELAQLSQLSDLYLNMNNLSGKIPPQIGNMPNLQVLQLCYNKLTGSIPTQLGSLNTLSVLTLQSNQLTGAIPASLGNLETLTRLDLSFNNLFGSVPLKLAATPLLEVLDIRNNTLSGNVPLGNIFLSAIPVNLPSNCTEAQCSNPSKYPRVCVISGVVGIFIILTVTGIFAFSWHRRQKQKIGSAFDSSEARRLSTNQAKEVCRKSASPLISLEYSNGWDPLAKGQCGNGFSQEVLEGFMFNLEEVERATQCFSEVNLLGKSNFSATYKGILRDGSVVAIKCIAKTSCKSDEAEFLKGLKILISLKHENLVRLRGICCSKGRGECFLIYDFAPNGNLLQYLDVKEGSGKVLDWSTRKSIINGIARGIGYLHGNKGSKSSVVHQNISAEKVFMDGQYNPLLSESGLHKLLADDIVFSNLKTSAAMGYLAPEYTTTGRFTEKSDVYAFGMLIFQILGGKRQITQLTRHATESSKFEDFIDQNLGGKFPESEAAGLGRVAIICTHDSPNSRPSLAIVMQELSGLSGNS
ncbi:LRR receptor-like serine/threonine-protein kinase GSO1 [Tripterygium wilfordii]|uniref:LRR receptor-like serine/threonine-protein kinase GSO1 n=1 Tax=Tripterygium wilfordii TaxID=458696 RepID=A0A7J7DE14_TRIWF|nr:LRR receptor-like serine/threonine-protein kinase GSO1 [Tripterygium wilfordii]